MQPPLQAVAAPIAPVYPRGVSHIRALLLASSLALAPAIAPAASIQVTATSPVVIVLGDSVSFIMEITADPGAIIGSVTVRFGRELPRAPGAGGEYSFDFSDSAFSEISSGILGALGSGIVGPSVSASSPGGIVVGASPVTVGRVTHTPDAPGSLEFFLAFARVEDPDGISILTGPSGDPPVLIGVVTVTPEPTAATLLLFAVGLLLLVRSGSGIL